MYDFRDGKLVKAGSNFFGLGDYIKKPGFESGGAGIVTTVDDYARFACMLAAGRIRSRWQFCKAWRKGKSKVNFAGKTVEFMTANQLTDEEMKYYNWDQLRGYGYGELLPHNDFTSAGTEQRKPWRIWMGWVYREAIMLP